MQIQTIGGITLAVVLVLSVIAWAAGSSAPRGMARRRPWRRYPIAALGRLTNLNYRVLFGGRGWALVVISRIEVSEPGSGGRGDG
jgi:hypothetical protein